MMVTPLVPACWELRQENHEFKAWIGYNSELKPDLTGETKTKLKPSKAPPKNNIL